MAKSIIFGAAAFALLIPASVPVKAGSTAETDDKLICKYRMETGTRFKKKKCMTAAQWDEMSEQHRAGAKEMVDRPKILICGPQTGC
jgi:hypothetical protein